ncbi:hypothetical protein IHE45_17G110800 [Dioscorea alata]|uniref:Uncharacterized protein n=1 Tax=Dioscorea alata TaxID=55571 RepID=A0ACB7UEQ2_DIOAL|nr:hypothetical protein IHE45_17G110800 [Dioscorea alata]
MHKNVGTFSGTEVCLSSSEEENIGEFVKWAVGFVRKDVVIELLVEHINNDGSRCESFLPEIKKISSSLPVPNIKHLVSGLEDYVLRNENGLNDNCHSCVKNSLMVGTGQANCIENNRGMTQIVEAVVIITPMPSCSCCCRSNCSATQVLYFQDFSPCTIPDSSLNALTSIPWQSYGLKPPTHAVNDDKEAVLEWENLQSFAHISIAIHSYHGRYPTSSSLLQILHSWQSTTSTSERNLTKKAIKLALDDVKKKHTTELLSSHAKQVCEYVPDLSRAIAGLILSSNDSGFQEECAALLGLQSVDNNAGEKVESIIKDMITGIIKMNDRNLKRNKQDVVPCLLFECEEDNPDENYREAPEESSILDL